MNFKKVYLTARVHPVTVGVEPLNTGEWVSSDIAINQCAAPLSGNYLAHACEHSGDRSSVCRVTGFRVVSVCVKL